MELKTSKRQRLNLSKKLVEKGKYVEIQQPEFNKYSWGKYNKQKLKFYGN